VGGVYPRQVRSSRVTVVAALSCLLALSACSGSEGEESSSQDSSSTESGSGGGTDDAAQTSSGDDADGETADPEDVASVSLDEAQQIATDRLSQAAQVQNGDGEEIKADARSAYRGHTYYAALAADELEAVDGKPERRDLISDPVEPNVLAISREDGQSPLLILAQTVPDSGAPELFVLSSPDDQAENFRIAWWAPMLPGTDIGSFDRRSVGSPVLREGPGDLSRSPRRAFTQLAELIDYPAADDPPRIKTNGYAPQVREAAEQQASEVSEQAEFSESNTLKTQTYTFYREDGSAVSFAALKRESEFDVRAGMELTPPETFLVFEDDESITSRARLNSYVYAALTIPVDDTRPEMVAAREQLISAAGS
jgi:hypothetical protein